MESLQPLDTNSPSIAARLGLFGQGDPDLVKRVVFGLLAIYVVSFAIFYPDIATNDDEAMYLRQARLALHGPPTATQIDPMTGQAHTFFMSTYAPGTAMQAAWAQQGVSARVFDLPIDRYPARSLKRAVRWFKDNW